MDKRCILFGLFFLIVGLFTYASSGNIVIQSPANTTYNTTNIDLNWSANVSIINAKYILNDGLNITILNILNSTETIDSDDIVGEYTSIAIDSNAYTHISYFDSTNSDLKYAKYNGSWYIETIDSDGIVGEYTSIGIDSNDSIHISYYDNTNSNLKHAKYNGSWYIETVDSAFDFGKYTSIYIDSNDSIHISYFDDTSNDLKYAKYNDSWYIETVDNSGDIIGQYTSLVVDSNNYTHISYWDATNDNLKYAKYNGSWNLETIDSEGLVGRYTSIDIDSNDYIYISYYDMSNNSLKYAKYNGSWNLETIDSPNIALASTSIVIDSNDSIHISYRGGINNTLKYAKYNGSWNLKTVDSTNFVGEYSSIDIDPNDYIHISYFDDTNSDLKYYKKYNLFNITIIAIEGSNNITVYANGTSGSIGSSTQYFTIDTTNVVIASPTNTTYSVISIDLNWSSNKIINTAWYSLNGESNISLIKWTSNISIVSGLGSTDALAPTTFQNDSVLYMIYGEWSGVFNGYNWSGSTWQLDTAIVNGLDDIGTESKPTVFQKDGTFYLISGEDTGVFYGFNWSGSTWQSDPAIIAGLGDVGLSSTPTVFQKDSVWYLISGEQNGVFNGYHWDGSLWQSNTSIVSGLDGFGVYSTPTVYLKDDVWYFISGTADGSFVSYSWSDSAWQLDPPTISGLGDVGAYSTPTVFQEDNTWYLITGEFDDVFIGFNWLNQNTTIIPLDGSNNITVYANSTLGNVRSSTQYFTGDAQPTYYLNTTNSTHNNAQILHSLQWQDTKNLSGYIFSYLNNSSTRRICYQETANESTTCGVLNTGSYYIEPYYFNINYTIPMYANRTESKWQVSHGNISTYNITIPESCWTSKLQLRIYSNNTNQSTQPYCYNASEWIPVGTMSSDCTYGGGYNYLNSFELYDGSFSTFSSYMITNNAWWSGGCSGSHIYEEAMWWDVPELTNDTWVEMNGTLNWSNVTKLSSSTIGDIIQWKVYANDTFNNWNISDIYYYTTTNMLPTQTPVTITPLPAEVTDNLTCNHVYADEDGDPESGVQYRWFINGILNVTTQILSYTSTSLGDNIKCSVDVYDGYENSSWVNSSELTLGDTTAPVLHTQSLSSTSGTIGTAFTVGINATEANAMNYIYVEITTPGASIVNYTMVFSALNGLQHYYTYGYTPILVGTYTFNFYGQDGSGNNADGYLGTFDFTAFSQSSLGGDGAESELIEFCGDGYCSGTETLESCPQDCMLLFEIDPEILVINTYTTTIENPILGNIYTNAQRVGRIKIKNLGIFDKTLLLSIEPKAEFSFVNNMGEYVYEVAIDIPKREGLESGEKYIDWNYAENDKNINIKRYNYTISIIDGKNQIDYNVVVNTQKNPFGNIQPIHIMIVIIILLFLLALFPIFKKILRAFNITYLAKTRLNTRKNNTKRV